MRSAKKIRLVIGSVLVVLISALVYLDYHLQSRTAVSVLLVSLGMGGSWELARMARQRHRDVAGGTTIRVLGLLATGYYLALAWWLGAHGESGSFELFSGGLAGFVFLGFLALVFREDYLGALPVLLVMLLGTVCFGVLFSFMIRIYHLREDATRALTTAIVLFLGVKGTDIIAYLVGSAIGRHHFLKVSPGKTIEGSVAALVFGTAWFTGVALLWPEDFFRWPWGILFGILLAVTSPLGDLTESLLKRYCQVKDSGALLPEFGGVLDLIDSFIYSGFLFWCLL